MDKIEELLTRGVEMIYPTKEELEKVLRSGKKLTLYQGFDPTGDKLHIGHMIGLMKLRQWQELGHKVIFLIGDGTGQAGDPSGKLKARDRFLTRDELRKNATDYVMQAAKIVHFAGDNPVEIRYNADWLNKLDMVDILNLIGHFSLQQLIERDLFQERIKKGIDVNLREFFYPLLQGYDSVAMEVDLELGGTDQTFNMLCGRKLVKEMLGKDKFVMTTPLLTDSAGRKIGKTEGNVIAIIDKPDALFGKIMALPDSVIISGFAYLTLVPLRQIKEIENDLKQGKNPIQYKKQLAFEIVKFLNDQPNAEKAQKAFENTIQDNELPADIPVKLLSSAAIENLTASELLVNTNLTASRSDAKRLIGQGGVKIGDNIIDNPYTTLEPLLQNGEALIQVGKRRFVKIKIQK